MNAFQQFDSRELRRALGTFYTGVTVVTTVDRSGRRYGLTANSFSSVSLDPPLILWSQSLGAPSYPAFLEAEYFAVNILAHDQIEVSNRFASPAADKFAETDWFPGLEGLPLIAGCSAYLQCRKFCSYPGGDHSVFLGEVQRFETGERHPLVFGNGKYMMAMRHELQTS